MRFLVPALLILSHVVVAQPTFTRADSLRGYLFPERACYDVLYYGLDLRINPADSSLSGSNTIVFRGVARSKTIQLELFANMRIDRVRMGDATLPFTREGNSFFVTLPQSIFVGNTYTVVVEYSGRPQVARRPPWDGGFVYRTDADGTPWMCVTCQGTGASLWWPLKDHQDDEPDSMMIAITVPEGLQNISNGRLRSTKTEKGWTRTEWFVSYPINSYNVTFNIGTFAHFSAKYKDLTLDYYVKPENLDKAKKQFAEVPTMFECLEPWFGAYPFPRDGFKLIESPHNGMEHQSAVAYGNRYLGGYVGRASSAVGLKFDFIIIHETAHEWWGNNVSSKDIADMWIHESFGAYTEALYVECRWGYDQSLVYINGKRPNVQNDRPIIGIEGVHYRGSGDMYDKGQLVLNTIRSVVDDDTKWTAALKGLQSAYGQTTITASDVFQYMDRVFGKDLGPVYKEYFRTVNVPTLQLNASQKGDQTTLRYRWTGVSDGFAMPFEVKVKGKRAFRLDGTTSWQTSDAESVDPADISVDDMRFYITPAISRSYIDPRLPQ